MWSGLDGRPARPLPNGQFRRLRRNAAHHRLLIEHNPGRGRVRTQQPGLVFGVERAPLGHLTFQQLLVNQHEFARLK